MDAPAPADGDSARDPYRVCVVGCGAIGMHIAARLVLGGRASVTALARGETLAALRRGGTMHAPDGSRPFVLDRVCEGAGDAGEFDAVVVAAKANQLASLAGTLSALLQGRGPELPVFFALNGIPWYYFHGHGGPREGERLPLLDPGDALWAAVGPGRAVHVSCLSMSSVVRPGEVQVNSPRNIFKICEPSGNAASPRAKRLAEALSAGGVQAEVMGDMRHEVWFKLLGNISVNPVSVLTGGGVSAMVSDTSLREAALAPLIREAMAVAKAMGVDTSQFPSAEQRLDVAKKMAQGNTHPPSMLQDFQAGRPMEIHAILGQVRAFAVATGVPTPTLEVVLALVATAGRINAEKRLAGEGGGGEDASKRPRQDEGGR